MLNKSEKEDLVIKLLNEGRTTREIAKEVHISFRQIGEISRKIKGEEVSSPLSLETQALMLFEQNKTQVEVAITLNMPTPKVSEIYEEYLRLSRMEKLVDLYDRIRFTLPKFLKLFDALIESNMSVDDFVTAIDHICQLPIIEQRRDKLLGEIDILTNKKSVLTNNLEYLSRVAGATHNRITNKNMLYTG